MPDAPTPAPFPWRAAMAFGLGVLRLSPNDFWSMSPRELAAAYEGVYGAPPERADGFDLQALMLAFPDKD
jgi:uncharacterized phage protein (TIGR02216 family)